MHQQMAVELDNPTTAITTNNSTKVNAWARFIFLRGKNEFSIFILVFF